MSATATRAAPGRRANSESPLMMPPMPTPIAPPTSSPSSQTSMLWAQPSRCSLVSEDVSESVSQRGSRPARHSSATWAKRVLAVVHSPPRRSCLRRLRPRWTWPTPITGRGSGDHHATQYGSESCRPTMAIVPSATRSSYRTSLRVRKYSSGAGSGMSPCRYAPSTLAGLRSAPNATGPSAGLSSAPDANDAQSG